MRWRRLRRRGLRLARRGRTRPARLHRPGARCAGPHLLVLALAACGAPEPHPAPPRAEVPPQLRAELVLEPPRLRIGDVAVVEVVVATPPGHRVAPIEAPAGEAIAPLDLLDARPLALEEQGARWVHRTRFRARARAVGPGAWPPLAVEVLAPSGERARVATEARPFEVVSVLPEFPDRVTPFPLRWPESGRAGPSPLAAAAAGAAGALALVAGAAALRRVRRRAAARRALRSAGTEEGAPWREALAALEAASSDTEWRRAADAGARALRRFVARRFGFPVDRRTTEEAAGLVPPFALASRWPAALACLRDLDAVRFRPDAGPEAAARVSQALEAARAWIARAIPPEAR